MNERVETSLRWVGDWPWWVGVPAAILLGAAAFVFYRRDVQSLAWWLRVSLPAMRAASLAMIVVMLSGPVLHHRKTIGELAKLWVFIDGSQSMTLTDASMDTGRKVLVLQRLGLLKPDTIKTELPRSAEALAEAQGAAERAQSIAAMDAATWKQLVDEFSARVEEARGLLSGTVETERIERAKRDLVDAFPDLAKRSVASADELARARRDIGLLGGAARRWQDELRALFEKSLAPQLADDNSPLRVALVKFDALPRWQRVQSLLLDGEAGKKLLGKLATNYEVQVLLLDGHTAQPLWQPTARNSALPQELPKPAADISDLATGLKNGVTGVAKDQHGAVIVFTDGQHNDGESPVEAAKVLGGKGTPVFPIGVGSQFKPRDLAVLKVTGPESVFHDDRYRGEAVLKDDVPAGQPFTLKITDGDKIVWEQKLITEGRSPRRVAFDFPVKEITEARLGQAAAGAEVTGFAVELKAVVTPVEGERELSNNEGALRFRAVTQKRRILIVDGRPRWETRYLRNMFERDEQWEVNCVIAGSQTGQGGFVRGDRSEQFPTDAAKLQAYDLIFFGEIPRMMWKEDELQWIHDFVAKRGGALVFIDGARGSFREYEDTPLAPVFPVQFKPGLGIRDGIAHLVLTDRGAQIAAFSLTPEKELNAETWLTLPAPHWLSDATPQPGAEVLVEAEVNGQRTPAAVVRPFGAGQVYYHAFDDSWRWRHDVADQWHVKFWNQIAAFAAEPPFAVRDKFVALDAGAITYQPGDTADLRVRLRDGEGKPVSNATVDAALFKDGRRVASIRLSAEEGGIFRGKTAPLEPGNYEVAVETAAIPENQLKARTAFKVEPRDTGELTQLNVNEDLLRQVAAASGGRYVREENFDRVLELLAPMTQGKVVESDTVLWQSWWWFLPILGLLTIEWLLRKRAGML
ncbi:MAG: hypothetical protein ABMA13_07790 [Chthoniobacteraceae bacterium]